MLSINFTKVIKIKTVPTKRAPDVWDSAAFSSIFYRFKFFLLPNIVHAHPKRVTPPLGTKEGVPVESCQCKGLERETQKWASEDIALYRNGEHAKTTSLLVKALIAQGVHALSLLDIGGGIGIVQLELLNAGATAVTSVEASTTYIHVAREEAARAAREHQITYIHGDFVSLADTIPKADIVTLDRVICCYDNVEALVSLSASKARRLYGVVYPRSTWWVKILLFFENIGYWLRRSPFRAFVHSSELVDQLVQAAGLAAVYHKHTLTWQVVVYRR